MALIVETGAGMENSETYVSQSEFSQYLADRGMAFNSTKGSREQTLLLAMDFLESQRFIGTKKTLVQALQWPRKGAVLDGFYLKDNVIPRQLKIAQMEIAVSVDLNSTPNTATIERQTKKEKVGDLEVEYESAQKNTMAATVSRNIVNALQKLIKPKSVVFGIERA